MKLISIENNVYRIKNKDYNKLINIPYNSIFDKEYNDFTDMLDDIRMNYNPILYLDEIFLIIRM